MPPRRADGHGHIGDVQLAWMESELRASAAAGEQVILIMHQLLVPPLRADGTLPPNVDWRQDFVDNRLDVLRALRPHSHVRLSLHGHVHANTLASQGGVVFVTVASAAEFPMEWREVIVLPCELRLRPRALPLPPALVERSRLRETRGVNDVKRGLNAIGGGYEGATFDAVLPACPRTAARRLASAAAEDEGDEGDAPGAEAWEYDAAER